MWQEPYPSCRVFCGDLLSREPLNKHDLINLTTDAEVVKKSFVSDKTLDIYIRQLVRFTLRIFDNKPEYIVPSVLETFIDANVRDIEDHENRPTTLFLNIMRFAVFFPKKHSIFYSLS